MDLTTLSTIFSVLGQIASFIIKYGPDLIPDVVNVVNNVKLAWESATSGTALTPAQQTQIDNALDAANSALAAGVAAAAAQDAAGAT